MTMFSQNQSSRGAINVAQLLAMREGGIRNDKSCDFKFSRLRCFNHPVVHHSETSFRKKVQHSKLYADLAYTCKFAECPGAEHALARSRADGWLTVMNPLHVSDNGREKLERKQIEHNAIVDFAWMPNEFNLVSGSADGKITFWQINSLLSLPGNSSSPHTYAVRTINFSKHRSSVFASGGQIGDVFLYDSRSGMEPIFSLRNAHDEVDDKLYYFDEDVYYEEGQSVVGLAFPDENTLLSCTFGKRIIKAWDLRNLRTRYDDKPEYKYSLLMHADKSHEFQGFTSLSVDPSGKKLYARCSNESIYRYDLSTPDSYFPEAEYKTGRNSKANLASVMTRARLSPDGKHILCSSNSDSVHIWNTDKPGKPVAKLTSPGDVIKSADWSRAKQTRIATDTEKNYIRLWQEEVLT